MNAQDVARLVSTHGQIWRIEPADDVLVMGAEAEGHTLTLWLAGPTSNESLPEVLEVRLIDEIEDGMIAVWTPVAVYELPRGTMEIEFSPWLLVRNDKRVALRPQIVAPSL